MLVQASVETESGFEYRKVELCLDDKLRLRVDGHPVFHVNRNEDGAGLITDDAYYTVSRWKVDDVITSEWILDATWEYLYKESEVPATPRPVGLFTIGDLLSGIRRPPKGPKVGSEEWFAAAHVGSQKWLYVIRDGSAVLYVGQTTIPVEKRIRQHVRHDTAVLGQHFRANVPHSFGWAVEVLTVECCLDATERDLIRTLRPLLNIRLNPGREVAS